MNIQERSLRSLEWDRLIQELSLLAETDAARLRLLALAPRQESVPLAVARVLLAETTEAKAIITGRGEPALGGLNTSFESLDSLAVGARLSAPELINLEKLLRISRLTRSSFNLLAQESFPCLKPIAEVLFARPVLERDITLALEPDGTVKDSASHLLQRLRQDVRGLEERVKEELRSLIHRLAGSRALTDELYTMRHGRYVLPVNASMRYQVEGIVHDASGSGLTVYVEPLSVMELSNQIRLKQSEIEAEIERILASLCDSLRPFAGNLRESLSSLIELDCIFARGRLAVKMQGEWVELTTEPILELKQARHPLLVLQGGDGQVVANDVSLGGDRRALIITGPNTGGKTVLIKLVGLSALMVGFGLLPPLGRGSRLGLFDQVLSDIGDDQSIQESLSTFSSHMKNMVEILAAAHSGKRILVLLDEIGAGTDPREGAALSQAILEELQAASATIIASTHLGSLKTLAFRDNSFINGSFEFDEENLKPTYRLKLGVPGQSKATEVAGRLGLSAPVMARAQELLRGEKDGLDAVVEELSLKLSSVKQQELDIQDLRAELEQKLAGLSAREKELDKSRRAVQAEERARLLADFEAARELVRQTVAQLQRQPDLKKAEQARRELEGIKKALKWQEQEPSPEAAAQIAPGTRVRHPVLNRTGVVLELVGETCLLQLGNMKVKARLGEIELLDKTISAGRPSNAGQARGQKLKPAFQAAEPSGVSVFVRTMANTLDLRGKRVDEALGLLDSFVDGCVLGRISPFMIIHGHGTGAVKSAVRDFLKAARYAIKFRPGEQYEGGDGVTVVEITD
ncbi:MAG: endonuclease MutS2 [Candidatus Melainabacteria bacterium]|nr:endonuclease MutS2 [Candidatus Melainabacteria bacterium]